MTDTAYCDHEWTEKYRRHRCDLSPGHHRPCKCHCGTAIEPGKLKSFQPYRPPADPA